LFSWHPGYELVHPWIAWQWHTLKNMSSPLSGFLFSNPGGYLSGGGFVSAEYKHHGNWHQTCMP